MESLDQQLTFLREIDRLKGVVRQSPLLDRSRRENSAEHSWHLAMYAWSLHEYASEPVDVSRVIRMLLLHDIVEVDVGDTPVHGAGADAALQGEREAAAAVRLFGLLPRDQGAEMRALWEEFEVATTADARFAKAVDRFQPLLVNLLTEGGTWAESGVSLEQVLSRYGPVIERGAPKLWAACEPWVTRHFAQARLMALSDDASERDPEHRGPPPGEVAVDLANRLLGAWNARDLDGFVGLLAEDVEWYDPAMAQPPARGRAAVREFAEAVLEAFPDFRYEVDGPICTAADGSRCAIAWRISATHRKPLRPLGYAPTGRRVDLAGVDVLDFRDGKITRIHTAFDPLGAAEQLLGMRLRPTPGTWRGSLAVITQRILAWIARRGGP